jgi:hypothetical protein
MSITVTKNTAALQGMFKQEFRSVVESKNIFAPVATMLISKAKNIVSPYTSVTVAKAHTQAGRVPLGTLSLAVDELVLDRKIGNAITDYEEELSYAKWDIQGEIRGDLYASVLKKLNTQACADFVAGATVVAGTEDLSTNALVQAFLVGVAADAEQAAVGLKQKVDGATIKRGDKHGKAFVLCGRDAYVNITSKVASIVGQSSLKGIEGRMVETPYGVTVINMGGAADNTNRLIYGTGGALAMAFREDQIDVGMGEYVGSTTYDDGASGSGSDDLDITHGDAMLEKTWYIYAQTKGKNGIFADVQSLVSTRLMA